MIRLNENEFRKIIRDEVITHLLINDPQKLKEGWLGDTLNSVISKLPGGDTIQVGRLVYNLYDRLIPLITDLGKELGKIAMQKRGRELREFNQQRDPREDEMGSQDELKNVAGTVQTAINLVRRGAKEVGMTLEELVGKVDDLSSGLLGTLVKKAMGDAKISRDAINIFLNEVLPRIVPDVITKKEATLVADLVRTHTAGL